MDHANQNGFLGEASFGTIEGDCTVQQSRGPKISFAVYYR